MSLVIVFYFTSSMLNMFRTLIRPSSGACDFSIVSQHWSCVLVSMCVGVSVWLSWGGIRVAGWSSLLLINNYIKNVWLHHEHISDNNLHNAIYHALPWYVWPQVLCPNWCHHCRHRVFSTQPITVVIPAWVVTDIVDIAKHKRHRGEPL